MDEFLALDVETANADLASICQIGLVACEGGALTDGWKSYIDPQDYFDGINISIHGITEVTVAGAPIFANVAERIARLLNGRVAVCHTPFDRVAIGRAFDKCGMSPPNCTWLDTARVARRAWECCAERGYGLENVCSLIGYEYAAHDALEDAKAAAQVLFAATKATGLDLDGWLERAGQPIHPSAGSRVACEGNPSGPLWGEVIVFTGALVMPRHEAAQLASQAGCNVSDSVTKKTSLLVVGDQDVRKLAGHEKSSKHRKAEELIAKGQPVRILSESDFLRTIRVPQQGAA